MAPTNSQQPFQNPAMVAHEVQQPEAIHLKPLQTTQPGAAQPMNPQQPHNDTGLGLRGGEACPGTFCCIPCPIPCHFCIIPCC
ncbi:hypothetical protein B0T17DRAFT_657336 [Bombardia bombarda]|uniref:Uncharacterized protein n=1 Tax=Bombardia bombarda TaxID=252184 RepID=A0AA39WGR0_9PEZI|nr:hypothetical protein B0T17DRAFT_657336 [Bombardia bombarda]